MLLGTEKTNQAKHVVNPTYTYVIYTMNLCAESTHTTDQ